MKARFIEIARKGTAIVIVLFCVFQIFRMWKVFLEREPVLNPLIPQHLETGIRNYVIFFTVVYLLVFAANIWSWRTKKAFYLVTVLSIFALVGIQFFYPRIISFFLNYPLF